MRARALGALGVASTVAAAAVVLRPDLANALSEVVAALESQDPKRLMLALGAAVAGYAAWAARASPNRRAPNDGPAAPFDGGASPETVSAADRTRTGAWFDARTDDAYAGDPRALERVRSALAETATSAYARAADCSPEAARRAVETGTWTDDRIAAAFLAGDDGPGFSLWARLRAWLDPAAERRRRVERTVAAADGVFEDAGSREGSGGGR